MYNFTQTELQQMQDYIKLAQAYHQIKDFKVLIRDIQDTLKSTANSPDHKQALQNRLVDTQDAKQRFEQYVKDTYNVTSMIHLDARLQKMEPAITQAFQKTQEPPALLDRAYTQVQAEQQRRQETQDRYSALRDPHAQASHQTDEQPRTKMPQAYGESGKHNDLQPTQGLSQDEQNRLNSARTLDAQYGIGEAQKLNEQKLDFEDLYRRPSRQRGPERSGPER